MDINVRSNNNKTRITFNSRKQQYKINYLKSFVLLGGAASEKLNHFKIFKKFDKIPKVELSFCHHGYLQPTSA